jgi:hypothetical protein
MVKEISSPTTIASLVEKFDFPLGIAIILLCTLLTLAMPIVRGNKRRI